MHSYFEAQVALFQVERRIINGASSDDDDDKDDSDEYTEQLEKAFDGDDLVESPSSNEDGDVFIAGVSWIDWRVACLDCVYGRVNDFDPYIYAANASAGGPSQQQPPDPHTSQAKVSSPLIGFKEH